MDKAERLLDLVALLLDSREPVPFSELRELFSEEYGGPREAAERKLERDKAELLQLGVPIEYVAPQDDERELGGYRIDRKQLFMADPRLLPEEAAALYAAGAAALESREFPFAQDLQHALRKISLASASGPSTSAARRLIVVRPGRGEHLRELSDAVARRKRIHIVYSSPPSIGGAGFAGDGRRPKAAALVAGRASEETQRDVDPWGLAFRGGAWRLVGYCHLRQDQRTFVVDRISSLRVNDKAPQTPDFEPPKDFDAGEAAGRKPWQWGSKFFPVQLSNGEELQVSYLDGLIPHVLQQGLTIRSPEAARRKVREALQRILELHAKEPSPLTNFEPPPPEEPGLPPRKPQRDSKSERLRRLLLVVPAVRKRPGIKLEELANELRLDADELREDIELLGYVGRPPFAPDDLIDISVDERGRVQVALDQSFERPPQLVPLEALALAAACEEVAPADPAVRTALEKLTARLPPESRDLYKQLAKRLVASTPLPGEAAKALEILKRAAENKREVALRYQSDPLRERLFHPQGVIDHAGAWYAIGQDPQKLAERTFRIDRIVQVRETSHSFADLGPLDPKRFERERLFFPTGKEEPVELRFSEAAAQWALFRYGSRARLMPDGRAEVWIDAAGSAWAVALALSFAGEAEIAFPLETRAALIERAGKALRDHL
jgi:proteasome accessory factor B